MTCHVTDRRCLCRELRGNQPDSPENPSHAGICSNPACTEHPLLHPHPLGRALLKSPFFLPPTPNDPTSSTAAVFLWKWEQLGCISPDYLLALCLPGWIWSLGHLQGIGPLLSPCTWMGKPCKKPRISLKNLPQPKLGGTIPMEMSIPADPPLSHLLLTGEPLTSPDRFLHCLPDLTIIKHFLLFSPVFFFLNFKPLVLVLPKIYY